MGDPNSFELNMIRHTELMPTQKYDLPMTRNQEIGWLISNPVRARTIRDLGMTRDYSKSGETQPAEAATSPTGHGARKSKSTSSLPKSWPHIPAGPPHAQWTGMNRKRLGKKFCPITLYADNYHSTMHHSPFMRRLQEEAHRSADSSMCMLVRTSDAAWAAMKVL